MRGEIIGFFYHKTNKEASTVLCSVPQFLDSLRRRANARNISFRISLQWPIHIINPVDIKTKLPCYTSHRRSTTVSLETYPYIHMLCSVVKHLGSGRALKKWGKTLDFVSCFPPTLLSCSTATCVLYNRTEHSRGFFIC